MQTEESMTPKWHTVEGATITQKGPEKGPEKAVALALKAWHRKHNGVKPEAVFMATPFAETCEGLPVIADSEISASIVYVGVKR